MSMKTRVFGLLALLSCASASAGVQYFGYATGVDNLQRSGGTVTYTSLLREQNEAGIFPQVALVAVPDIRNAQGVLVDGDYLLLADALPAIIAEFNSRGTRMLLALTPIFFYEEVYMTDQPCTNYPRPDGTFNLVRSKHVLWPNHLERLRAFLNHSTPQGTVRGLLNASNTELVVIHGEANNSCILKTSLVATGQDLLAEMPGFDRLVGFPTTHVPARVDPETGELRSAWSAQPLPSGFYPWSVNKIATWSYGIYDPTNPSHPRNPRPNYYNPSNPADPATDWGQFTSPSRLRPDQQIVLVIDGHYLTDLHYRRLHYKGPDATGKWLPKYGLHAAVQSHWCRFALSQPRVDGLVSFLWQSPAKGTSSTNPNVDEFRGVKDLLPGVRARHQVMDDTPGTGICPAP